MCRNGTDEFASPEPVRNAGPSSGRLTVRHAEFRRQHARGEPDPHPLHRDRAGIPVGGNLCFRVPARHRRGSVRGTGRRFDWPFYFHSGSDSYVGSDHFHLHHWDPERPGVFPIPSRARLSGQRVRAGDGDIGSGGDGRRVASGAPDASPRRRRLHRRHDQHAGVGGSARVAAAARPLCRTVGRAAARFLRGAGGCLFGGLPNRRHWRTGALRRGAPSLEAGDGADGGSRGDPRPQLRSDESCRDRAHGGGSTAAPPRPGLRGQSHPAREGQRHRAWRHAARARRYRGRGRR